MPNDQVIAAATPAVAAFPKLREALHAAAPKVDGANWVPALSEAFAAYGIATRRQVAAAVGQFLVEAGPALQSLSENLNYTTAQRISEVFKGRFPTPASAAGYVKKPEALANAVYANRLGNGNEASGDGWRFRGLGLIQITGRNNYARFAASRALSVEEAAALCTTKEGAALSGCWFLTSNGYLPHAEGWDIEKVTCIVNGKAKRDAALRLRYSQAMLDHL